MSVGSTEPSSGSPGSLLGPVNSVMGAIFDSVEAPAPEAPAEPGGAQGAPAPAPAVTEPGAPAAPAEEPPADGVPAPAADAPAAEPAGGQQPPAPVRSQPPVVTADDRAVVDHFSQVGEAVETRFLDSFRQQAIAQAKEDYPHYISALEMHALELVGKELPSIDGSDNTVSFRTAAEVAEWQEAVKVILRREMEASVEERQQASNEVLDVVHSSIEMFRDNPDMVPGTKGYNKALAVEFIRTAEPYALKLNGKLIGFSIPVQGLINQARARVASTPAATPPAPKSPAAPAPKPQAGIPSKAGAGGGEGEDYSPMWNALGIKNVPI